MKRYLPITVLVAISVPVLFLLFGPKFISTARSTSTTVLISEIQTSGISGNDEFIELYNASITDVDLTGWRLTKRPNGSTESNLVASMSGTIPAHGYFLLTQKLSYASPSADAIYNLSIASDNAIALYAPASTDPVDLVGLGLSGVSETTTAPNPPSEGGIERKANAASTAESMTTGTDADAGNGYDTDNNFNDFITRETSDPQNSNSSIEPAIPLPTPTATPEPTPTPTEIPAPTPTETPIPTPTDIPEPTATPTEEPTPTPTDEPTPTPTIEPTPTETPVPTATPTPDPTPTPTTEPTPAATLTPTATPTPLPASTPTPTPKIISQTVFSRGTYTCYLHRISFRVMWFTIRIPRIHCSWH